MPVIARQVMLLVFRKPTRELWLSKAQRFNSKWNFPNCVGAIDRKNIVMQAPPHSGSSSFSYKGTFLIVLMAIADADYGFTYISVGEKWPSIRYQCLCQVLGKC